MRPGCGSWPWKTPARCAGFPFTGPLRLKTEVAPAGEGAFDVTLLAWREAANESLSRFEPVATGRVRLAPDYETSQCRVSIGIGPDHCLRGQSWAKGWRGGEVSGGGAKRGRGGPQRQDPAACTGTVATFEHPWDPPPNATPAPDPYESGTLFHGPSFQLLRSLKLAPGASSSLLDAAGGGTPRGLLHEALLDALTHGIPHDRLCDWSPEIPADRVAYPHRIVSLRLFAPLPAAGEVRCETRFAGFDGAPRFPRFQIQAIAGGPGDREPRPGGSAVPQGSARVCAAA